MSPSYYFVLFVCACVYVPRFHRRRCSLCQVRGSARAVHHAAPAPSTGGDWCRGRRVELPPRLVGGTIKKKRRHFKNTHSFKHTLACRYPPPLRPVPGASSHPRLLLYLSTILNRFSHCPVSLDDDQATTRPGRLCGLWAAVASSPRARRCPGAPSLHSTNRWAS